MTWGALVIGIAAIVLVLLMLLPEDDELGD